MDKFSFSIYSDLIKEFPELEKYTNADSDHLEVDIPSPNGTSIGGLVIQTTAEENTWVRIYPPCSGYSIDTIPELLSIVKGVLSDQILWVTGFKDNEWVETTLINSLEDLETEEGVMYNVFSWSGKNDHLYTAS